MTTGCIKRLMIRGFGFIAADDGLEYFFHCSALANAQFVDLREGARVAFLATTGPKGLRAEAVEVA